MDYCHERGVSRDGNRNMNTWKTNWEESKTHYVDWWNGKGIVLSMWEHLQDGVKPHADVARPEPHRDLKQYWFDPQWRADNLHYLLSRSSFMADIPPVANTHLGPGSLAARRQIDDHTVRDDRDDVRVQNA